MFNVIKKCFKRNPEEAQKNYLLSHGMKIGENCNIYSWNEIDAGKPWLISIGNHVTISTNVTILTHDASMGIFGLGTKLGKVKIGNHVFIGANSTILCNVTIGDNVIVGAGSVVTHSLESNWVYAGSPVRRIYSIDEYKTKYKELRNKRPRLDQIRSWYDWENATEEEKKQMSDALEDGCGFF